MPAAPLTHHEILGLVGPFTRRGHHVDLAASDRAARKIAFKPAAPDGDVDAATPPALRGSLQIECHASGVFTLTRTLADGPSGLQATLLARGTQPETLLARVEAVNPAQQFQRGAGFVVARSYEIDLSPSSHRNHAPPGTLTLSRGVVQVDGLTLTLGVLAVRGVSADVTLAPATSETFDLPEDLLAVLGWDWARLVPAQTGWTSKLRLRGDALRRTATAERALDRAARHLVQVLTEPPAKYHQRHLAARWGVVLRRSIPSITAVLLIGTALMLPRLTDGDDSGLWMALHYVPIAVLALSFSLQELPRFEIPPLPRRPRAAQWRAKARTASGR